MHRHAECAHGNQHGLEPVRLDAGGREGEPRWPLPGSLAADAWGRGSGAGRDALLQGPVESLGRLLGSPAAENVASARCLDEAAERGRAWTDGDFRTWFESCCQMVALPGTQPSAPYRMTIFTSVRLEEKRMAFLVCREYPEYRLNSPIEPSNQAYPIAFDMVPLA